MSCRCRPRASWPRSARRRAGAPRDACRRSGVFEIPNSTRGFESAGQTRYLFHDVWDLPSHDVTVDDILAGLPGTDVVVIPDGFTNYGLQALGAKGKKALRDWVNGGGRIVAWQGGALLATKAGISTTPARRRRTRTPRAR